MNPPRHIAVLDIGKTHKKFAVVDLDDRSEMATVIAPNPIRTDGAYPHFDTDAIWSFFSDQMKACARSSPVDGIAVAAHGASIVLIGDNDLALPVLDYEYDGPDELAEEYDAVRPDFADTFSPRLPKGINVGAQLFWLQRRFPEQFASAVILTYPQYWLWRMTGLATNEITSIGCHTDLWDQRRWRWSSLAESQGWTRQLAPLHSATTPIGNLRDDLVDAWGLKAAIPVAGGLHDSNASLVPHLIDRKPPFSVLSTGTWAISFGVGARPEALDPARDTLANINLFGEPVPAGRFMGGREFSLATGDETIASRPEDLQSVLGRKIMLLPSMAPDSGPFQSVEAMWSPEDVTLSPAERYCAASLYLALMSDVCLELIAARGPTIVDGPFAANQVFRSALASLTGRDVLWSERATTGPSVGAALLFDVQGNREPRGDTTFLVETGPEGPTKDALHDYRAAWRECAETRWAAAREFGAPAVDQMPRGAGRA